MPRDTGPSTFAAAADVIRHGSRLVGQELALAKSEVRMAFGRAALAAGLALAAAVLAITALNLLAGAAVAAVVAQGFSATQSTLLVGGALGFVALLAGLRAAALVKTFNPLPQQAMSNLSRDMESLKESLHV